MKRTLNYFSIILVLVIGISCKTTNVPPPQPYGAIPSKQQMEWQKMEYYMFIHFGPNTFTDVEWGDGKEDPRIFNPSDLDCRQWAKTAKEAGMTGIIITAKHHDGFCLWPSKYSTHTVRESLWKDGKGDVLKELSEACEEFGLKFGVYLSPWDQNHPDYGTPKYNQIFANTLNEVLTGYGEVFEQWFDGANGEGPNGKKQPYDWDLFHQTVYKNQPNAIIFSDVGPGCRWIGNENGYSGTTNWSRLDIEGFEPGKAPSFDTLNSGNMFGSNWIPAEADVSIRPGWFYSPSTNDKVKTVEELMDIYYASVGRNSNLLLNIPPDRTGRIHKIDSTRLMAFKKRIDDTFNDNLLDGADIIATTTRGNSQEFAASNLLDGDFDTYWATDDDILTASFELNLNDKKTFNHLVLQEYIPLGQRIANFNAEYWDQETNTWELLTEATTIGYKRILKFPSVTTNKIKINILNSLACPVLSGLFLYNAKEFTNPLTIEHNKDSLTNTRSSKWKVISKKSESMELAIDGNSNTFSAASINENLSIDLGETLLLKGFSYWPVNNNKVENILKYNFYTSLNGEDWVKAKNNATFPNIKNNPIKQDVLFESSINARFIKLEVLESTLNNTSYTISEIGIITP